MFFRSAFNVLRVAVEVILALEQRFRQVFLLVSSAPVVFYLVRCLIDDSVWKAVLASRILQDFAVKYFKQPVSGTTIQQRHCCSSVVKKDFGEPQTVYPSSALFDRKIY